MSTPSKTSNRKRSFFTKHQSTRSAVEASEPPKLPRPQRPVQPPEPPKRTDSDSEQSEDEIVDKARMKNMSKAITISSSDDSGDEALSTQLSGTEHEKPVRRHSFEDQDFTELEQAMNEIGSDEETCTIKNCLKCVMGEHGMPETVTKVMYKKKPRRKHSVPVAKSEWAIIRSRQRKRPKKRNLKFRSKFSWIDVCSGKDDCNCMKCVNPDTEWDPPDIAKKDDATSESRKEPQQQDPRPRSSSSSQKPPKKSSAGLRKPSTLPRRRRPKSKLEKQVEKDRKKKAQRLPDSPPRCHINKIRKEKSGHKIRKQRNTLLSMGLQEQRKQDSKGTEENWKCFICTYDNKAINPRCAVCNGARAKKPKPTDTGPKAKTPRPGGVRTQPTLRSTEEVGMVSGEDGASDSGEDHNLSQLIELMSDEDKPGCNA